MVPKDTKVVLTLNLNIQILFVVWNVFILFKFNDFTFYCECLIHWYSQRRKKEGKHIDCLCSRGFRKQFERLKLQNRATQATNKTQSNLKLRFPSVFQNCLNIDFTHLISLCTETKQNSELKVLPSCLSFLLHMFCGEPESKAFPSDDFD